jgi:uncharacterized RDD family membrane protein YckC
MADDAFSGLLKPGARQGVRSFEPRSRAGESSAGSHQASRSSSTNWAVEPQRAVRARLNAIILDLILLGLLARVVLAVVGAPSQSATVILLFLALQFAYFFGCEVRHGQTIGKRIFHVRVATLEGTPPNARQVAWRTILRIVDSLPLFYASGLISLMRTGPARRQRIGDVVAGTTVVLDAGGKPLRTPAWVLPLATIVATVLSIPLIVRAFEGQDRLQQLPVLRGFSSGPGAQPVSGRWRASAQATSSVGYGNIAPGERYARAWQISRHCSAVKCGLFLTVALSHESPATAPLIRGGDGWHATFPVRLYACGYAASGHEIYWPQSSSMVLHFTDGGLQAQARERDFSETPGCGYGTDTVEWTASRA